MAVSRFKEQALPLSNLEFKILADFKILAFQNPEFKILVVVAISSTCNLMLLFKSHFDCLNFTPTGPVISHIARYNIKLSTHTKRK